MKFSEFFIKFSRFQGTDREDSRKFWIGKHISQKFSLKEVKCGKFILKISLKKKLFQQNTKCRFGM